MYLRICQFSFGAYVANFLKIAEALLFFEGQRQQGRSFLTELVPGSSPNQGD